MKKQFVNEGGLTLIEVLASLIIISIVLISFLSILLQATKHTKYNEEKLTEVDIAEEVIGKIRGSNDCLTVKEEVEQDAYKNRYKVVLKCDSSTEGVPTSLARALVSVEVKNETNAQKRSEFKTETYYKKAGGAE